MALKIGIVTEYYYPLVGGITENVHHTAKELVARGHSVTIISANLGRNGGGHLLAHPNGIPTRRIGRSFTLQGNGAIAHFTLGRRIWRDMKDLLSEERFDVLQLHSPLFFTLPPIAALLGGNCARVGTFHSYFDASVVYSAFKNILQTQFVNRLEGVTVVSPSVLRALSRYFDLDARVIPNGVDTRTFNPRAPRLARFTSDKQTLLFLGRFDPRNGLPLMLKAFTKVHRRLRDVRLVVVGSGPMESDYRRMAPDDVAADVHFEGATVIDRPSYYTTADLFCSPINNASFGVTLLEAMACGTPVVATENVGYRDLLGGSDGLLTPHDADAFADAIIQLLGNQRLRGSLREAGLRKAERFAWPIVVDQLLQYFKEILDARQEADSLPYPA
jgi:phosphatidylinositol alpha-mannosyltransferase